jgi:phosphomannomutase
MSESKSVVKFGTDGWRGIIADDFTYANVRVAERAIAHCVLAHEDGARGGHWVWHPVRVAIVLASHSTASTHG